MADPELTTEFLHQAMPFTETLGIRVVESGAERIVLELDWRPALCTSNSLLHGGAIMALADSGGGATAMLNLPEGAVGTSTIESKTNFLRGATEGPVTATSTPLHRGSTTIVVETEVRQGERLIAKVTQTQAVLRPR